MKTPLGDLAWAGTALRGTHDQHNVHLTNGSKRTSLSGRKINKFKCGGNPTGPLLRRCCTSCYSRRSGRRRLRPRTLASPRVPYTIKRPQSTRARFRWEMRRVSEALVQIRNQAHVLVLIQRSSRSASRAQGIALH